ncbi:MAG: hypothetical protein KDI19_11050 [Pseudomonadales bacterium]|nr:hypothetical protein [Pseudomonadales bacterium]
MKVFVPVSDEVLTRRGNVPDRLVPFNPAFLEARARQGRKPANWISESDYSSACRRLRESDVEARYSHA